MKAPISTYPALPATQPLLPQLFRPRPRPRSRNRRSPVEAQPRLRAQERGRLSISRLAVFLGLVSAFSALSAPPPGITQNAVDEMTALLHEKASWTPALQKLDSALIHALKKSRGQPFAARASNLRQDLVVPPDGRVLVDINANVTPQLVALIKRGGTVVNAFPGLHAVRALVSLNRLETRAAAPDVACRQRAAQAYVNTGSVDSQGDATHLAAAARSAFGAT